MAREHIERSASGRLCTDHHSSAMALAVLSAKPELAAETLAIRPQCFTTARDASPHACSWQHLQPRLVLPSTGAQQSTIASNCASEPYAQHNISIKDRTPISSLARHCAALSLP
eukprot:scaffold56570_cov34-Tisochrysis_lutea.AAC.4